jgi:hypothetical protein
MNLIRYVNESTLIIELSLFNCMSDKIRNNNIRLEQLLD